MQRLKTKIKSVYLSTYITLQEVIHKNGLGGDKSSSVLVLPPAPPGSLGDEALVTGIVEHLQIQGIQRIGIVTYGFDRQWKNPSLANQTNIGYHYLHGSLSSSDAFFHFAQAVSSYGYFYCIGADVMDGYYSEKDTLQRLGFAALAHRIGVKAAVISFSFNDQPTPNTIKALQELPAEVRLCTRDPISYGRLTQHLKRPVQLGADLAFLLTPSLDSDVVTSISEWVSKQKSNGQITVGINANYKLIEQLETQDLDQLIKIYSHALISLRAKHENLSFLLIPHDFRDIGEKNSDVFLAEQIFQGLPAPIQADCAIVPTPCSAKDIKGVCKDLDIVLSGRMHLAIACLGQGTPAVCITYQGKFEGLYKHFDLTGMTIEPKQALQPESLVNFFLPLIVKRAEIRHQIEAKVPEIVKLAQSNIG